MKKLKPAFTAITVVTLFLVASAMDYQDQIDQQAYYCEMVQAGNWPAFKDMGCDQ